MKDRIKQLRTELEYTQEEFAKRLGLARNSIANYEIGRREPTNAIITSICREFNVNEEWLRTGEGEMFRQLLPTDEIAVYVEDLLEYDGHGNAFYDMIIEMMKAYHGIDDKSKTVIRDYFGMIRESIKEKKED